MSDVRINGYLTLSSGILVILAVILGSGILVLPGLVFKDLAGSGLYVWLICTAISLPILMTMVLLGEAHPSEGGVAYYARLAFGRYLEMLVSFLFLGAVALGLPAIAKVGGIYLQKITGINFDPHLLALILIGLAAFLCFFSGERLNNGIKLVGGWSLTLLVLMLVVLLILALRMFNFNLVTPNEYQTITQKIPLVFFAYTGWEIASHLSADFKNPAKDYRHAMALSFLVVCSVYIMSALLVHITNIQTNFDAPIYQVMLQVASFAPSWIVPFLGVSLILANLFGSILAVSRLVLYLSNQGVLPTFVGLMRYGVPRTSIVIVATCLAAVVLVDWAGFLDMETMFRVAGVNFLIIYAISGIALIRLRKDWIAWVLSVSVVVPALLIFASTKNSIIYPTVIAILVLLIFHK